MLIIGSVVQSNELQFKNHRSDDMDEEQHEII